MVKHKLARRALQMWAKHKGERFTTNEAMQYLDSKNTKSYSVSQKQLNNILGKTKKVKSRDGIMYGYRGELIRQPQGQRMLWEYIEYE